MSALICNTIGLLVAIKFYGYAGIIRYASISRPEIVIAASASRIQSSRSSGGTSAIAGLSVGTGGPMTGKARGIAIAARILPRRVIPG